METVSDEQPTIATNREGEQVAERLSTFVDRLGRGEKPVSIATAYFNPAGFSLLAEALQGAPHVRLLLGAEPQPEPPPIRQLGTPTNPERLASKVLQQRLEEHEHGLHIDRNQIGFSSEASQAAQGLIDWLNSGQVEVKRLTTEFLHGKAFIVSDAYGGSMVGSSNFTYAGLAKNLELNLFTYDPNAHSDVSDWYEELWDQAEPFDLAGFYAERFEEYEPWLIYIRMLWEQYWSELEEVNEARDGYLDLPEFSRDAVIRARFHLHNYHGVLLADDVGLGKTFQAGELIAEAVHHRDRVLVIAPAVLRDSTWQRFVRERDFPVQVVSFQELASDSRLGGDQGEVLWHDPNDYSMVVIDEAHNARNPSTQRAEALRMLFAGNPPKDVVLVTATPVNNSLWDLYHLLKFFVRSDSAFAAVGVADLRDYFADAMAVNPEDLTAKSLFDVLDRVSVRRTRPFIKRYYPNATINVDGKQVVVTFPTPRVRRVSYQFSEALPHFIEDLEVALDGYTFQWGESPPEGVLAMARYAPSMYRKDRANVEAAEVQLAGLLRSLLLKRFESSPRSFASTCQKMANSHVGLIDMIRDQGKVATGQMLAEWLDTEGDDTEIEDWLEKFEGELDNAADYDVDSLCNDLANDERLLARFAERAQQLRPIDDPKLALLVDELAQIAAQAKQEAIDDQQERNKRKVLLFSYFADTVDWITDHLKDVADPDSPNHDPRLAIFHNRITSVSGTQDRSEVLYGFCPATTEAPSGQQDLYDIVVSTDVLAEGVNLQQARHVINYDLPWNPQKLTQRHGRVDRLLSHHTEVFIRCFFPAKDGDLDRLLALEARLRRKMNQAVKIFGGHNWITDEQLDVAYMQTREEIAQLIAENPEIFIDIAENALGGEEYRQQLRNVEKDETTMKKIASLPWGSGSGFKRPGGTPGWVFCVRVSNHPEPVFRFVEVDPETYLPKTKPKLDQDGNPVNETEPIIEDKILACIGHAQPFPTDAPREIPEKLMANIYEAWDLAKKDVHSRWQFLADPLNLQPKIPLAMRDAEALIRSNPDNNLTNEQVNDYSRKLLANYSPRIWRQFRRALRKDTTQQQISEIITLIDHFALTAPEPPKPLQPITLEDINLITWMAISN